MTISYTYILTRFATQNSEKYEYTLERREYTFNYDEFH